MTGAPELPDSMPAAVYRQPGTVSLEDYPVPALGADEVLVEVSHCGICGSDLHMVLEGWGKPGIVDGHEFSGTHRRRGQPTCSGGRSATRWSAVRRRGAAAATLPRRAARRSASSAARRSSSDDARGRSPATSLSTTRRCSPCPTGMSLRGRPWPSRWRSRLHGITRGGIVAGDARWSSAPGPIGALVDRRAGGPGHRPSHGRSSRAPAASELARASAPTRVLAARRARGRSRRGSPTGSSTTRSHVVLECSGKGRPWRPGFSQLAPGRRARDGRRRHRAADVRPEPHAAQRAHRCCGSFVYDADGFERALELLASRRLPDRRADRAGRRAARRCSTPWTAWPRAHRRQGDGRARRTARRRGRSSDDPPFYPGGNPRFNHVAMSVPADQLDEADRADLVPRSTTTSSASTSCRHDDGRPPAAHLQLRALGPVHLPHRRGRPDALPAHGPLRLRGRHARASWTPCSERAVAFREQDPGSTSSTRAIDDQGVVKIHSIYVALPAADDGRDPVLGVQRR